MKFIALWQSMAVLAPFSPLSGASVKLVVSQCVWLQSDLFCKGRSCVLKEALWVSVRSEIQRVQY